MIRESWHRHDGTAGATQCLTRNYPAPPRVTFEGGTDIAHPSAVISPAESQPPPVFDCKSRLRLAPADPLSLYSRWCRAED